MNRSFFYTRVARINLRLLLSVIAIILIAACKTTTPAPQTAAPVQLAPEPVTPYLGILYTTGQRRPYSALSQPAPGHARYGYSIRGARIVEVLPQSPAQRAGLRVGDTILSANGEYINESRRNIKGQISTEINRAPMGS